MHKEEIILVHLALFHIKQLLEAAGFAGFFQAYEELGVLPTHIYRMKEDHEIAIMFLCVGILKVFGGLENIPKVSRDVLKKKGILTGGIHQSEGSLK